MMSDRLLYPSFLAGMALLIIASAFLAHAANERRRKRLARIDQARGSGGPVDIAPESSFVDRIGRVLAGTSLIGQRELDKMRDLLRGAGFHPSALHTLLGLQVSLMALSLGAVFVLLPPGALGSNRLLLIILGLLACWRGPLVVLAILRQQRTALIEKTLPDVIDLLVICGEAGLSLESSVDRVRLEMVKAVPPMAAELETVTAELRVLPDRTQAFQNLSDRLGLDDAASLAMTLSQATRYGTPLGHALRVLSHDMRARQQTRLEERAAKLPAIITLPMMLFVMPATFVVMAGLTIFDIIDMMNRT